VAFSPDAVHVGAVVVGGISMGAGVALHSALRYPAHVKALILSRPAWLDVPGPANLKIFRPVPVAATTGAGRRQAIALGRPEFVRIQAVSRDNAASILRQLERPNLEATIATLASLPADAPCQRAGSLAGYRGARAG